MASEAIRARRLHPLTLVFETIRIARHLVLPALAGAISATADGVARAAAVGFGILAIPAIVAAIARYVSFRYHVTDDELILDSGIFSRRRRIIPLSRIQNVDVRQKALERICGVASLLIETAGGKTTEGVLSVLGRDDADALRARLLASRGAAPDYATPVETLARLSPRDLVVAGATANEIGLVAAALLSVFQAIQESLFLRVLDAIDSTALDSLPAGLALAGFIIAGAVALLLAGWLLSIGGAVIGYHGFTLERAGDELRKRYGLFARREGSVPLRRVQAVRIEESLMRRPFGLAAVRIETAGSAVTGRRRHPEAFVPLVRRDEVAPLVARVLEGFDPDGVTLLPVHPRTRRRIFARLAAFIVALAAALALLHHPGWLASLVLLVPTDALARNAYANRRYAILDDYVLVRVALLGRTTWIIPRRKIQTVHVASSPFQRRHGLATLIVDTASGPRGAARIRDLPLEVARELADRLSAPMPEPAPVR